MKSKTAKAPVAVIIPIYQATLQAAEYLSLTQCCQILGKHPIIIIKPASLDIQNILNQFPEIGVRDFPDHYFAGIDSYNQLLISIPFYQTFVNFEFILIYQLDAFVFRDELLSWCAKPYDYIGAPSLHMEVFNDLGPTDTEQFTEALTNNRVVLNGGLSLRRVSAVIRYLKIYNIFYPKWLGNEDMLFSQEATRLIPMKLFLKTPKWREALQFAFEKSPAASFIINNKKLPFACHAWERYNRRFWEKYIS